MRIKSPLLISADNVSRVVVTPQTLTLTPPLELLSSNYLWHILRGSVNGGFQAVVRVWSEGQIPAPHFNLNVTSVLPHVCATSLSWGNLRHGRLSLCQGQMLRGPWPCVQQVFLNGILIMVIVFFFPRHFRPSFSFMGNIPVTTTTKIFHKTLRYKWEAHCNTNGRRIAIQMAGVLTAFPFPQSVGAPKVLQDNWRRLAIQSGGVLLYFLRSSGGWGFWHSSEFNLCSASNLEPRSGNHGLQTK